MRGLGPPVRLAVRVSVRVGAYIGVSFCDYPLLARLRLYFFVSSSNLHASHDSPGFKVRMKVDNERVEYTGIQPLSKLAGRRDVHANRHRWVQSNISFPLQVAYAHEYLPTTVAARLQFMSRCSVHGENHVQQRFLNILLLFLLLLPV